MTAPNSCEPCNCIPSTINNEYFKQAVITVLCETLTAITGGGGVADNVNLAAVGGTATAVGNGVANAGTQRVTIASDNTPFSVNLVNGLTGFLTNEDGPSISLEALGKIGFVRQDTPASSVSTDGDWGWGKINAVGALYVDNATQAATYADAHVSGAAGAIPTTGVVVLTNSAKAKILSIGNTLDVAVLISADAGVTYPYYVPATTGTMVLDLGSDGRWTASNIFAKALTSNSSSGTLHVGLTI